MLDEADFGNGIVIKSYDSKTHTSVTLPRLIMAYLFRGDTAADFYSWVQQVLIDEPEEFQKFVLEHGSEYPPLGD